MADDTKQPVQAAGQGGGSRRADEEIEGGRTGGGESGGGAYKDKDQVKGDPGNRGFTGHGGQSHIAYSGPGGEDDEGSNPNAPAGS